MSRKPRFLLPGTPQHIIQRGHNREPCFYDEADYRRYQKNLHEAAEKDQVSIHAYVLMTNYGGLERFVTGNTEIDRRCQAIEQGY